jgi:hypothetical protein
MLMALVTCWVFLTERMRLLMPCIPAMARDSNPEETDRRPRVARSVFR